jgi:hypothetical protein
MAAPTDILTFVGYPTVEPGDVIAAYRNDWCVGRLQCGSLGDFSWVLMIGHAIPNAGGYSSLDEAKAAMAEAFTAWCATQGLTIVGPARFPAGRRAPEVWIEEQVLKIKDAGLAEAYMRSTDIKRHLSGMTRGTRGELGRKALAHIATLRGATS